MVVEKLRGRLERGRVDDSQQVVQPGRLADRLVEPANSQGGNLASRRMGVEDDRVAGRQHVDCVGRQGRQAVCDRGDCPDDSERRVVGEGQSVVPAGVVGAQVLDARNQRDRLLELGDLVIEPADLGLFQLSSAQLVGPVNTDSPDAVDGLLAVGQTAAPELLEGRSGRLDGGIDGGEYTEVPCRMSGRLAVAGDGPVAHLGQDLLNHVADQIFSHLHGRYRCKEGPVGLVVSCRSEREGG